MDGPLRTTRVSLELDRGDGAISGRLDDGTRTIAFSGWLMLAASLERMRRQELGSNQKGDHHERSESRP